MVEIIKSQNLAYFPIRKVGNTSIRAALRQVAKGPDDYKSTPDVPLSPITKWHARGCTRIVVVRDPVRRFLSAYGNRIQYHRDATRQQVDKRLSRLLRLERRPDLDTFCRQFAWYYWSNDKIRRHFRLQRRYLGGDLGYFHRIYRLENLQELADDLSEMAGKPVSFPRLQTGGPKIRFQDLSPETQARILRFTAPDYALLADYYRPPAMT